MDINKLYSNRFDEKETVTKNSIWKVLCRDFFQKYIPPNARIVDIAAGYCEFINNINAQGGEKIAIDINPSISKYANDDIRTLNDDCTKLSVLENNSIDIAFTSNFFEHIDKTTITKTLLTVHDKLKVGGKLLLMGPNIKYVYKQYWDFYDHHTPLSESSLSEALGMCGYNVDICIDRFMPYSSKSKIPKNEFLISMYLKLPFAWKFFGKQFFIVASKTK